MPLTQGCTVARHTARRRAMRGECRLSCYLQTLSQLLDRPMDQDADVALALAGDLGNLPIGKPLTPKINGLALARRELGHLPGQLAAEVLLLGEFGRVGLAADKRGQVGLLSPRAAAAGGSSRGPCCGRPERARGPRGRGELLRTLAKLQEGMLHRLPGGISIAQKPRCIAHQRRLVAIQDRKHPLPSSSRIWHKNPFRQRAAKKITGLDANCYKKKPNRTTS